MLSIKSSKSFGEVAERFKAAVLKTVDVRASVGSNPTFSDFLWRDGREAEGASLLRKYTGNGIGGSNPPLSVIFLVCAHSSAG